MQLPVTDAGLSPRPADAGTEPPRRGNLVALAGSGAAASQGAADATDVADVDNVSLSADARVKVAQYVPAPVYAEIWKGSVKLAEIDIHGHVSSHSMLVPSGGGGLAGPLVAAQRALQLEQQTGGEIRIGGQPLDGPTLLMRARLANAYAG